MLKKIRILGHDFTIKMVDDSLDALRYSGQVRCHQQYIWISGAVARTQQRSILIHEIIEALDFKLELKLEHHVIMSLEAGLSQVFEDNPKFLELWSE